jgi:DNA-binding SARP family transcriptional activator/tetratricopeptide (TPR) repeat protein
VRITVLGPVEVHYDHDRILTPARRQERLLLGILALNAGEAVPIDRLCALLWEDNPPANAHAAVRTYVARVRAVLAQAGDAAGGGVVLESRRGGYLLAAEPEIVDAHRFRRLLSQAGRTDDLSARDRLLRDALALWRGPALQNAATDQLRERLCADLTEQRLHAIEESMGTGLALGRHRELLPDLARLNTEHPLRERLVELHMLALYRDGRTAEALDVYDRTRTRLADELGLDPSPALRRLHGTIARGEPVPAAGRPAGGSGDAVTPAQLPANPAGFAGRVAQLDHLDAMLTNPPSAVVISAIAGTAGVGKTALAVHWAHRVRHRFPDGQLYVNLRGFGPTATVMSPADAVRGFLDALAVPAQRIPSDLAAQTDLYRGLLADKRMLVVLDNARDADQLGPLLPGAPGCMVLVTSRTQISDLATGGRVQPLTLDLLTPAEARQLLARRLGPDRVAAEPDAVEEIIARCAHLPLALAIVAARAATHPEFTLTGLAGELRDSRARLDALTAGDPASDVRVVFSWSYQTLGGAAALLFRLLGLYPGPDISAAAAASLAGLPLPWVRPLLAELTAAHLIVEHAPERYSFHDLLRPYAAEQAHAHDSEADRHAALHRLFDHYVHTAHAASRGINQHRDPVPLDPPLPEVTPEDPADAEQAMAWFTIERPVLLAAIDQPGFDRHTWQLAWALADFFDYRGHWHDWTTTQEAALAAATRMGNRSEQARAHRILALACTRVGRHEDGYSHLGQALELYQELGEPAGQAHTHRDLAVVFHRLRRHREALDHALRSLEMFRAADHRAGEARALNMVGYCYSQIGEHGLAIESCAQALPLFQELGLRSGEAATWDSIGYAHHYLGHYSEAIGCFERALELFRQDGIRYQEAETLTHLGDSRLGGGDPGAAEEAWRQALTILEDLDHPEVAEVRARLDRGPGG